MLLSDAELTAIRADIANMLPGTAYVLSVTRASDGAGWFTETWGTAGTVSCRLDPLRGHEQVSGGAVSPFHQFVLTLPWTSTLTTENRVTVGGITYSVISVDAAKTWKASTRAVVEKL